MCLSSYHQHSGYFRKFWLQELIFKFSFRSFKKLPFKYPLPQRNQFRSQSNCFLYNSKSSNASRHQIFTERDTARHGWGKAMVAGKTEHPCPQGVCSPAEKRYKTPQLLCKVPGILLREAKCWRGSPDMGELAWPAQEAVHQCTILEQKVACLGAIKWSLIFMNICETMSYFTLSGETLVEFSLWVMGS